MSLNTADGVNLVFGRYRDGSFKNDIRKMKGSGPRVNVKFNVVISKFSNRFLAHSKNISLLIFCKKSRQDESATSKTIHLHLLRYGN